MFWKAWTQIPTLMPWNLLGINAYATSLREGYMYAEKPKEYLTW